MAFKHPDHWRMQNVGLEGVVLLARENRASDSLKADIVYYIHDREFRKNTLSYDDQERVVYKEDRRIRIHPSLDNFLGFSKATLFCYGLAYLVSPEIIQKIFSLPTTSISALLGFSFLAHQVVRSTSSTAIDAWNLYKEIESAEL